MTNFRLSFKKKNKKFLSESEKVLEKKGTGPIFCMRMSSFLQNGACPHLFQIFNAILQVIKFYKTSNPKIRIIICKKRYIRRKYD